MVAQRSRVDCLCLLAFGVGLRRGSNRPRQYQATFQWTFTIWAILLPLDIHFLTLHDPPQCDFVKIVVHEFGFPLPELPGGLIFDRFKCLVDFDGTGKHEDFF